MSDCAYALVPQEAAFTLMRLRGVKPEGMTPEELASTAAEAKAASDQIKACTRPRDHEPPHRDKDGYEWTDPDPDDVE